MSTNIAETVVDGLSMECDFIRQNEEALQGHPTGWQVKWRCRLYRNGQPLIDTDYSAGIGHLEFVDKCQTPTGGYSVDGARAIRKAVAYGDSRKPYPAGLPMVRTKQPDLDDVLYCLVSDSEALDYPTFEDWAGSLGYDTDSRSAEKTYRACLEIGLKLRNALGDAKLQELREAFQNY